jgi:hypothetical protein
VVRMHPGRNKSFVQDVGHDSSRHFCLRVYRGVHKLSQCVCVCVCVYYCFTRTPDNDFYTVNVLGH